MTVLVSLQNESLGTMINYFLTPIFFLTGGLDKEALSYWPIHSIPSTLHLL